MFGEVDKPDLEELEMPATKWMQAQVATAEEADVVLMEGPIPEDGKTQVMVTQVPVPLEFGLQPDMYPVSDPVKEISKKDPKKKTTKFYYMCRKFTKSSQNKISMYTHAHRCFNIILICSVCQKTYESHDGIDKHITEIHGGSCAVVGEEAITKTAAE